MDQLPSDGVNAKPTKFGLSSSIILDADGATALTASKSYVVRDSTGKELDLSNQTDDDSTDSLGDAVRAATVTIKTAAGNAKTTGNIADGDVITRTAAGTVTFAADDTGNGVTTGRATLAEVNTENAFVVGLEYEIASLGTGDGNTGTAGSDAAFIKAAATNVDGTAISGTLTVGQKFTVSSSASTEAMAAINSLIDDMEFTKASDTLTKDIEAVQAKINTARVQAGSQYAAMESAVDYTTDLTAQYELGFNTVNDVNFSMETAHLAKNQILQQAATAMLAQANQGQQGLLQLIQG